MRELSIFVDESGDLGEVSRYYLISLVFHDQADKIDERINRYERALAERGLIDTPFHAGPLLCGHDAYQLIDKESRRHMLTTFRAFTQHLPFSYATLAYEKASCGNDSTALVKRMKRDLIALLSNNLDYFQQYDCIKIYYDNGQPAVTEAIHDAIDCVIARNAIVYRNIHPSDYRLFQVADYVCTIELTAIKYQTSQETQTDRIFFGTWATFKSGHLKYLRKKKLC